MAFTAEPETPGHLILLVIKTLFPLLCVFKSPPTALRNSDASVVPSRAFTFGYSINTLTAMLQSDFIPEYDDVLASYDCKLTAKQVLKMCEYAQAIDCLEGNMGQPAETKTIAAVDKFLKILERGDPSWYYFGNINMIIARANLLDGMPPLEGRLAKITKRYLKIAETERDPYRIACCSLNLAHIRVSKQASYKEVEKLLNKHKEALDKCRAWLPSFFIRIAELGADRVEQFLQLNRESFPENDQQEHVGYDKESRGNVIQPKPALKSLRCGPWWLCGSGELPNSPVAGSVVPARPALGDSLMESSNLEPRDA